MKGWVKIGSYSRLHQAELRKELLKQNNVNAVVLNEKDSAFLLGSIELMVESKNAERAKVLLQQFSGWTQVTSFIRPRPVELIREILMRNDLEVKPVNGIDLYSGNTSFELYVDNKYAEQALGLLDNIKGWTVLTTCQRELQIAHFNDILEENAVDCMVKKLWNEDSMSHEIRLLVRDEDLDLAEKLFEELRGWTLIEQVEDQGKSGIYVDLLQNKNIPVIERYDDYQCKYLLYVRLIDEDDALDIIAENTEWQLVRIFSDTYQAIFFKNKLHNFDIPSVLVTKKDSNFLIGDIELYVQKEQAEQAILLIDEVVELNDEGGLSEA